ncbi:hypothetical protein [Trichocoleus sp. FACHB-6]|nr:hypothetical protein [Trichocoleus sp. FACHB-6]
MLKFRIKPQDFRISWAAGVANEGDRFLQQRRLVKLNALQNRQAI